MSSTPTSAVASRLPTGRQGDPVEALERLARRPLLEQEQAERVAQPAHDPRGPEVVALHVADDEGDELVVDRDDVVPVAAHLDADGRGQVARRDVPPLDGRDGVGQQVALQLVRDPPLAVVGAGPDHDGADLLGQLLGQAEVLLGEAAARPGGDEGDGAEDLLVAQAERHRHVGGEAERLEDVVVAVVPGWSPAGTRRPCPRSTWTGRCA